MLPHFVIPLWKQILRQNFTHVEKLADYLELTVEQRNQLLLRPNFSINLPLRLAQKIAKSDLNDPILKQFLPVIAENEISLEYLSDPVGDSQCRKSEKLLHKYEGRVLLVCTSACAMHCRYCFRQNFDYDVSTKGYENELKIIAEDSTINEVILSGGDPLSLDNRLLEDLLSGLETIPHIVKVRFHTRFPIGIPERIDFDFLSLLKGSRLQFWFVIHANHPRELDDDVLAALKRIQCLGIPVLNQSVLLKGVNDQAEILIELSNKLVNHGISPYYLHQLDRVVGAARFEVSDDDGRKLISLMTAVLPGYAVPKYVREIHGMPSKTAL